VGYLRFFIYNLKAAHHCHVLTVVLQTYSVSSAISI